MLTHETPLIRRCKAVDIGIYCDKTRDQCDKTRHQYICMSQYPFAYQPIYVYANICVCLYMCMPICVYAYMCVCLYIRLPICVYAYIRVCLYICFFIDFGLVSCPMCVTCRGLMSCHMCVTCPCLLFHGLSHVHDDVSCLGTHHVYLH